MVIYNYKEKYMLKRITVCILALLCVLTLVTGVYAEEEQEVTIYGGSKAAVYNPQTGTFVYDKDGTDRTESATSTKMTALILVFDEFATSLDTEVTIESKHLKNIGAAVNPATPMIGLKAGGSFKVEELMKAACVSWANDAVNPLIYAYCDKTGIEYSEFADKMNEFVESIGCTETKYKDPLGRTDLGNRTCAKDVALICAEFYNRYDLFAASSAGYYVLQGSTIHTRNYLLSERIMPGNYLAGARGFFAGQAYSTGGYCVATAVENGPLTYIVVVLDGCMYLYDEEGVRYFDEGKNPYTDVKTLVNWAKTNFVHTTVCKAGEAVDEILLEQGKERDHIVVRADKKIETITAAGDTLSGLKINITYDTQRVYTVTGEDGKEHYAVKAPVTKGEVLGMAEYVLNGTVIGVTPLSAADSIDTDTVIKFFDTVESILFSETAKTVLTVVLVLAGLYVLYCLAAFIVRIVKKVKKDAADTKKEKRLKELKERKNSANKE